LGLPPRPRLPDGTRCASIIDSPQTLLFGPERFLSSQLLLTAPCLLRRMIVFKSTLRERVQHAIEVSVKRTPAV